MSYEEKYKEALERADSLIEKYGGREFAEYVFPELRECEDERIRKTLAEYFGPKVQLDFVRGIPIQKIRDWLEKQKEQKPDTRDADDLQLFGFIYDLLNEIEWKDNWAMSKDECLRRLNNYRPQKPTEWSAKGRRGRMGGIPEYVRRKAEAFKDKMEPPYDGDDICSAYETGAVENANPSWSDDDEENINSICSYLDSYCRYHEKDGYGVEECKIRKNWLKSLRPVNQEWSEEDETEIKRTIGLIEGWMNTFKETYYATDCKKSIAWLKSLRPSWKPSEEQMSMLLAVINEPHNAGAESCQLALSDLYQDLKKL